MTSGTTEDVAVLLALHRRWRHWQERWRVPCVVQLAYKRRGQLGRVAACVRQDFLGRQVIARCVWLLLLTGDDVCLSLLASWHAGQGSTWVDITILYGSPTRRSTLVSLSVARDRGRSP
jgi:hypothetical protein